MKNVYFPPYESLRRRGVPEAIGKKAIVDILTATPAASFVLTCGDFNARIVDRAPTIADVTLQRTSLDRTGNNRGTWMLQMCELTESHVLNGNEHQGPAQYTCRTGRGSSAVDYFWSQDGRHVVQYDDITLAGMTDHTLLHLTLPVAVQPPLPRGSTTAPAAAIGYRWDVGSTL